MLRPQCQAWRLPEADSEAHLLECGGGTLITCRACVFYVLYGAFAHCACVLRYLSLFCIWFKRRAQSGV